MDTIVLYSNGDIYYHIDGKSEYVNVNHSNHNYKGIIAYYTRPGKLLRQFSPSLNFAPWTCIPVIKKRGVI